MSEMKMYVGGRIPTLGTPVLVVGHNDEKEKKTLVFEAYLFIDGKNKCYHTIKLQSVYGDNKVKNSDYVAVVEKMIDDEVDEKILDEMAAREIPVHLYSKMAPCEPSAFTPYLHSLWSRGYGDEVLYIAKNSDIGKLRTEFSEITQLPKITVTISGAR